MKTFNSKQKRGFTLIEVIIVLMVVGILASVILPRLERDHFHEGIQQVVRHIRFTQHLAMHDDVYDAEKVHWYRALWRISFRSKNCYLVSSNTDLDKNYDRNESALDALDGTRLYSNIKCEEESGSSAKMYLNEMYDVESISFSTGCGANRFVAFSHIGEPLKTLTKSHDVMTSVCTITFISGSRTAKINIIPETGYVTWMITP